MKKLAVLALGVFIAACSETPTEVPLDTSDMLAMAASPKAAVVNQFKIDRDFCYNPAPGFPAFVLCVRQSGLIHETITSAGVESYNSINLVTSLDGYFFGELRFSTYSEGTRHMLVKSGELVQMHEDICFTDNLDNSFSFSSFLNMANGEVKHVVETAEGCDA